MKRTAVIGFGCAGYHALKAMREHGYGGEIHVYSNTDTPPANPMLTTYYVSGKLPHAGMFPFGSLEEIGARYGPVLHRSTAVTRIDSATRRIACGNGSSEEFDDIVLATGARALIPPLDGVDLPGVFSMRSVDDAELLKAYLDRGNVRSAVVIGASMVGIKLVELLQRRDIACTLADMAPHIFPTAALPAMAEEIQKRLQKQKVALRFSSGISGIYPEGGGLAASFGDGARIPCDIVLLCIGTRANTGLADEAVRVNRGIVVDRFMRTSAPGIWAAGDCCEGSNLLTGETQIIGLWDNAARQGETAGANIAGQAQEYRGNITHNITHFMDMDFIGLGDNRVHGEHRVFHSDRRKTAIEVVAADNRPVCVNILDNYKISGVLKSYLLKRLAGEDGPLGDIGRGRLLAEGVPAPFIDYLEGLSANGIDH